MAGVKRPKARILGAMRASQAAAKAGSEVKVARTRRRIKQKNLAAQVGITQGRLAQIEAGKGAGAPPEVWFALAEALRRYLRFEFARDPLTELADAGHLQIQELVLRVALAGGGGWEGAAEARSRNYGSDQSVDVRLFDRIGRRLVIGECWNIFGDLGASWRSSDRKLRDAQQEAVAIAGDGPPLQVGLVWIVRDSRANRELVAKYAHIFDARFPGSSAAWVKALTEGGPLPTEPGLIWCDTNATRLFAHRRRSQSAPR